MAAASFERALKLVLVHEGGFVNHPKDPGGATNLGITIGTARRLGIDVDGDGDTDIVDIKLLRPSDAAKVYRAEFWNKVRGDDLPPGVDYAVFDFAVNSGPARAIAALQRAVGVADDGRLGPLTISAAVSRPAGTTVERVCADRLAFMKRLSTWPTFGRGWSSRVEGVRAEGLAMAGRAVPTMPVEAKPLPPPAPGPVFPPAPRNSGTAPLPTRPQDAAPPVATAQTGGLGAWLKSLFSKKAS